MSCFLNLLLFFLNKILAVSKKEVGRKLNKFQENGKETLCRKSFLQYH
jgi:hypothetical protein